MRFLLLSAVLVACSTDTFVGDDGGGGDATTDGVPPGGASSGSEGGKADGAPFDPGTLGSSLVLWLDATDAKTGDAGDVAFFWPDHQNKYTTVVNVNTSLSNCVAGLHSSKDGKLNHAVVTFCNANLDVTDALPLHLGSSPFFVSAVISPAQSIGNSDVVFTKTLPGDSNPVPSNLTIVAPSSNNRMQGWLNGNGSASSPSTLTQDFHYVTFLREATQITARVDGQAGTPVAVNSSDDVSNSGANIGIGGYKFDVGIIRDVFRGELVELVVLSDITLVGPIELYLKKKYSL